VCACVHTFVRTFIVCMCAGVHAQVCGCYVQLFFGGNRNVFGLRIKFIIGQDTRATTLT
jgi:hypothetical protein